MNAQRPKRMTFPSVPTSLVNNSSLSLQTFAGMLQQQKT